jgi:hypothetical protein
MPAPEMDARYLGVYMLLTTQLDFAAKFFTGGDNTVLTQDIYGVGEKLFDPKFVGTFRTKFTDSNNLPLAKQLIVGIENSTTMSAFMGTLMATLQGIMGVAAPDYSDPPCPASALVPIVNAINQAWKNQPSVAQEVDRR